jgi:hypothetical protein
MPFFGGLIVHLDHCLQLAERNLLRLAGRAALIAAAVSAFGAGDSNGRASRVVVISSGAF